MSKIAGMKVVITDDQRKEIGEAIDSILVRGWLMEGPWQEKLVGQFTGWTGRSHGVTYGSESSALLAVFARLAQTTERRAVLVQANAFPSVPMAARAGGFNVGFVDVDADMVMDQQELEAVLEVTDVAAVVIQWNGGYVSRRVGHLQALCDGAGVMLIEDCAHASGSHGLDGSAAGSYGDVAVFSLAATKPLMTGQGGMLLTDDEDLATWAFQFKNYGRTDWFQKGEYVIEGGNFHMTEMQAAVGTVLFPYMEQAIGYRRSLLDAMTEGVEVHLLGDRGGAPNLYKVPIGCSPGSAAALREIAAESDIELGSEIYSFVTTELPCWRGEFDEVEVPMARMMARSHICLPMHNGLTMRDADRINEFLLSVADNVSQERLFA